MRSVTARRLVAVLCVAAVLCIAASPAVSGLLCAVLTPVADRIEPGPRLIALAAGQVPAPSADSLSSAAPRAPPLA